MLRNGAETVLAETAGELVSQTQLVFAFQHCALHWLLLAKVPVVVAAAVGGTRVAGAVTMAGSVAAETGRGVSLDGR